LFASVFSLTFSSTTAKAISSTTLTTIDSVTEGSDHTPHTLHSSAIRDSPLQQDRFPHQRHCPSNIQHTKSMNITSPLEITTRSQWHAWFTQRRITLKRRLEQAEQAEWNWPNTRRRCDVMRIEDEIRSLDAEEFVVPF
jgi:hypothetical protein